MRTNLEELNNQQREAVVTDRRHTLVLAGAGAGKTKTLLQRIVWLIEQKEVNAGQILAITFTRNAANEMVDRLILAEDKTGQYQTMLSDKNVKPAQMQAARLEYIQKYPWIKGLTLRTFHSFCYTVLRNYGVREFDNKFRILGDEKSEGDDEFTRFLAPERTTEVYKKILIELSADQRFLLNLKKYVIDYLVDKIHLNDRPSNFGRSDGKFYTTLNGTRVRSKSEQFIADWLYRNNIAYEYEPNLIVKDFAFHPDFYIPAANLYLEHVSAKSHEMHHKEEQFALGDMLCVRTYEHMANDSTLFSLALEKLLKGRLGSNYDKQVALSFLEAFQAQHDHLNEFVVQIMRVHDMIKVENLDMDTILKAAKKEPHLRVRYFYTLAGQILKRFEQYCVERSYLDFNDLLILVIRLFKNQPDILKKFQQQFSHILVDEFQDVNNLQVEFLRLLLHPNTSLFCVGDDWQSIYGFRGSNVDYIIDFKKHFKPAHIIKLDLNYRSTQHIVGASNEVIKHNKRKIDKNIKAAKQSPQKVIIFAGANATDNLDFCEQVVKELVSEGIGSDEILFLYRRTKMFAPYRERFRRTGLQVAAKTIHAAKGLESKVVFIIGLTEGYGGFPDIWLEDRIFQVIKPANHDLLIEEERRLFYVAITRAKERLYLITEKGFESSFLKEIPSHFTIKSGVKAAPIVEPLVVCSKCKKQIQEHYTFCPFCGKKLP